MAVLTALTAAIVTGVVTGAAIAEAAIVIGVTLSVAGAVTKDKTMSLVGAGLSLGAGVAGMMDPTLLAGLYVSGADAAGTSALGTMAPDKIVGQTGTLMHGAQAGATPATAMGGAFNVPPVTPGFTPDASLLSSAVPGAAAVAAQPSIGVQPADMPPGMSTPPDVQPIGNIAAPNPLGAPAAPLAPQLNTGVPSFAVDPSISSSLSSLPPITPATNIPDWWKMAMLMSGSQAITGMAGGLFAGATAEQKLELDKLMNEQNQQQRLLLNKQGSYVPKLAFTSPKFGPAGLINSPAQV